MVENLIHVLKKYSNDKNLILRKDINLILKDLNLNSIHNLLFLFKKFFLFHGSKNLYFNLKPIFLEDNFYNGLFASINPYKAMFYSLISKNRTSLVEHTNIFFENFYYVENNVKILNSGYLYLVKSTLFKIHNKIDFVSFEEVIPDFIIEVNINDFPFKIHKINTTLKLYEIKNILKPYYDKNNLKIHDFKHIERVVNYAKYLSMIIEPKIFDNVVIGAYLHDIGRISDNLDLAHGENGALIAKKLLIQYWPNLNHERILYAIEHHSKGLTSTDLITGIIWDSDRLDLINKHNIFPNFKLISMPKTKNLLLISINKYNLIKK